MQTMQHFAGRAYAAMLMTLLMATLKPCINKLQVWIDEGVLDDPFDEMLLCSGELSHRLPGCRL